MSEMQKQFEEWAGDSGYDLSVIDADYVCYSCLDTEIAWQAWQASRAVLVVELPVAFPINDDKDSSEVAYILDILEKLAIAGVKYK